MARVANRTVVEAGADCQQNVAVLHAEVGFVGAMHAGHADPARVGGREGPQRHERGGDGSAGQVGQLHEFRMRMRGNDTATHVDHGALGSQQHLHGLLDLPLVTLGDGRIGAHLDFATLGRVLAGGDGDVLGDIDQHRARPARARNMEGAAHGFGEVLDVSHQEVVLDAGAGDADRVTFLEGVFANGRSGHLAAQDHHGNGIHIGGGDACDSVGQTRATGHQCHTHLV